MKNMTNDHTMWSMRFDLFMKAQKCETSTAF